MPDNYLLLHAGHSLSLLCRQRLIPATDSAAFLDARRCAAELDALVRRQGRQLARAKAKACEEGWAQGQRHASEAVLSAFSHAIARQAEAVQSLKDETQATARRLALAAVSKLSRQLGARAVVPALIDEALRQLQPTLPLRIRVHPFVAESARQSVSSAALSAEVLPDENLAAFDCLLEYEGSIHIAHFEHQLGVIGDALDELGEKPTPMRTRLNAGFEAVRP